LLWVTLGSNYIGYTASLRPLFEQLLAEATLVEWEQVWG